MAKIVFTDVVDCFALTDPVGDSGGTTRINHRFADAARLVGGSTGTLVKSLGGGIMSTYKSTRAVFAATRTGRFAVGEVIEHKGDFVGVIVNWAARVKAAAEADLTRLSDDKDIMLGRTDEFSFSNHGAAA